MPKDEVVLLVSRAIAVIQCISAILEISYLPERLMSLHHYKAPENATGIAPDFLTGLYSTEIGLLCFRIAVLLVLAMVFWQCGPKLRTFLLPESIRESQPE